MQVFIEIKFNNLTDNAILLPAMEMRMEKSN